MEAEKTELGVAKATLETEKAALAAEVEAFKTERADVELKAFQMISELGINIVPKIEEVVEDKPLKSVTDQYMSLKGMEQAKFFELHKDEILNGAKA